MQKITLSKPSCKIEVEEKKTACWLRNELNDFVQHSGVGNKFIPLDKILWGKRIKFVNFRTENVINEEKPNEKKKRESEKLWWHQKGKSGVGEK